MAATEELRILLRTVADTAGLTQTEQALKGGASSLLAFGAAAGVAGVATDQLANLTTQFVGSLGVSIQAARDHERVTRATTASYGAQSAAWTRFSQQLSATTGFTSDAILEAGLSARTLSANYGLTIEQTQKLISVSADLARIRGIGVAEAFERVQSAIRGEAEASEYLGLTLNATYLKTHAMNGALKDTYETMTDTQKAQVIYTELLKQTAAFQGLAAGTADSLDASFGRAEVSVNKLAIAFGNFTKGPAKAGLDLLSWVADHVAEGFAGEDTNAVRFRRFWENLPGHTIGAAADLAQASIDRDREMARQSDLMRLQETRDRAFRTAAYGTAGTGTVPGSPDPAFASARQFAVSAGRIAFLDQVGAAVRDITSAQQAQVDLQRQAVDLSAQEASIRLGMLPAQERLAALQRDVTEQAIRAQQAALPATEALEDLRYLQERARLITSNRNATAEDRSAARRELRNLARAEPGVALAALDAGRGVNLTGRAVERVGLEQQLFQFTQERTLSQIRLAEETNSLLARIAEQRTQAIQLTVNLSGEGFTTEVYKQLTEAADQAQTPPVIPQSGVRR